MKYIVIVLSGAADLPCDELGQKTPLEVAKLPHLHALAKLGKVGMVKLTSDRLEPSPDVTLMNLLGYDAEKAYTGRGPLEAANLEIKMDQHEVAFRMNFITEAEARLADDTAGGLTTKEAKALINFLNKKVASDFVRFFAGAEYRHVAVLKDAHGFPALSAKTISPEQIVGEPLQDNFPKGPGEELLRKLMYDAKLLLQDHEINQVRVDLGENPANMIWLWGQGPQPQLQRFTELYGLQGALIGAAEYAKGLGRLTALTVHEIGCSQEAGEDLDGVARTLSTALEEKDLVTVFLTGADEASRMGSLREKITSLEAADHRVIAKARDLLDKKKDVRILVTSCQTSSWRSGKRVREAVPFMAAGKNMMPDDVEKFTELTAKASGFKMTSGRELMNFFLSK